MGTEKYKNSEEFLDITYIGSLRSQRKFEEVYNFLKEKYNKFPENDFIMAQYLISVIDFKHNASEEIKELSDKVLKTKNKKHAYMGYVMYYLSIGNVNKAFEYFKLLEKESFFVKKIVVNINDYDCSKEFRKLIFDVDVAIAEISNPDYPDKRYIYKTFDIAEYYYVRRDYKNALYYFNLSNERRFEDRKALCYFKIGKCYYHLCKKEEFKKNFEKALEYSKKYAPELYYKVLYEYIYCLNDFNECEEAYRLTSELEKGTTKDKNMALFLKGKILKHMERYDEAIEVFKALSLKTKTDRKFSLAELVKVYVVVGEYDVAESYVNELYNDFPDYNPVSKIAFYYDAGKCEECIELAKKYIATEYEDEAMYFIGRSLNRLRRYQEAKDYLEFVKDKVRKISVFYELGMMYDKLGRFDLAQDNYDQYINLCLLKNDTRKLFKGLTVMIELLSNRFDFSSALYYISLYQQYFPNDIDNINYIKAKYYYRKQDFELSVKHFKKLYGTDYENDAKNYLVIIYRYTNKHEEADQLLEELSVTEYSKEVIFNKAKQLKDLHTSKSLEEAYILLSTIDDVEIKNMINVERIQILTKLGRYEEANLILEEAYKDYAITLNEYQKFKAYLAYKMGTYIPDSNIRIPFMSNVINYDSEIARDNTVKLNESNEGYKYFYLSNRELLDLFDKLNGKLDNYDYYMSDLYDIYIIDMGRVVGSFFGVETSYVEVKCEQNTQNIHLMQPTCKALNATRIGGNVRRRTDLDNN